jgi:hypothetical protein
MVRIACGEEVVDSAMQVIANAVTVEQLRQAQAVVLPLRFAMSLQQTAEVTGLSVGWVSSLLYWHRFWSRPARAAFWWSVTSNMTLNKRWAALCRCRLFTPC